jgi:hypothetical protein
MGGGVGVATAGGSMLAPGDALTFGDGLMPGDTIGLAEGPAIEALGIGEGDAGGGLWAPAATAQPSAAVAKPAARVRRLRVGEASSGKNSPEA